ncbi:ATP-binding protein [Actibacterium sp. XHP0104]|uniref:hybrid sensor histidine kinase/response regulator n=1 Tax=Actibacterium sp. XHP0104 TaxID=2984335 RepID=UPI0021E7D750|nr:ATP-binding protein [Actibacterium sp. XHP0104]MCV2881243.1 ATP-binding protein [Actibacterium sp. XHP0104]
MSHIDTTPYLTSRPIAVLSSRLGGIVCVAALLLGVALMMPAGRLSLVIGTIGGTLAATAAMARIWHLVSDRLGLSWLRAYTQLDPIPVVLLGPAGQAVWQNPAADKEIGPSLNARLAAQPAEAEMLIARLHARAWDQGSATARLGPPGAAHDVVVTRVARNHFLWRLDKARPLAETPAAPRRETGQAVLDSIPVALIQLTPGGLVLNANRLARDLVGTISDQTPLSALVEGLGRPVQDWLSEVAEGRAANQSEVLKLARSDREMFVQVTLRKLEGQQAGLVAVLNDATELKTLETQVVQSQKMQAIGQLAGGVAHDFNNLLTAISGHCDLLMLRHDEGDQDYADLVQITQNVNRAAGLVGQLLAFSRKQTLRPEMVDLRETLNDLTHLLNRLVGERVRLTVSHDPAVSPIVADKRQLEQVIMNLVVNARDAMPAGGEIRIETAMQQLTAEMRRDRAVVPVGDYVLVRVSDEGTGIAPDKLDKIFEPFFTTKKVGEGTGLGLSTVYGIIKQSGGFIFVDSTPGAGTCFTLYFPVRAAALGPGRARAPDGPMPELTVPRLAPRVQAQHPTPPPELSGANSEGVILLVEDEAPVRAFASRALRMRGYTVLEAENAEQALDILETVQVEIDVFVTDVVMPGMDGPTWVARALTDRPETRVVFVSGYAEEDFAEVQARIPNSVFLPKPFSLNDLTEEVRKQMERAVPVSRH